MIVRKVKMVNFRWFPKKTIDFQGKPVVLLSAANGVGKTTTVDAIEWCLTGNIGRLKTPFDARSTNNDDRKLNAAGILKNRKAGDKEKVRVELTLSDGEREIVLCREQTKDELNPGASTVMIGKSKDEAEKFIREYIGDQIERESFYNFHFCDIQKSFNVQSTKRGELKEFFKEFITNYEEHKQIAKNLDVFAEDVERYVADLTNQKEPQAVIDNLEKQVAEACEASKQIPYPQIPFFPDEKTDIAGLNREALLAQREALCNCGYRVAQKSLDKLVQNETFKRQRTVVKEILSFWESKGASIQRAVQAGFPQNTETIAVLDKKLRELERLSLSKNTILWDGQAVVALENAGFTQSDLDAGRMEIQEKEKKVKILSSEIDLLTKNNKMLKLLSTLTSKKQVVVQYRDAALAEHGTVRCPVCGSESFASVEAASILKEAEEYSRLNGETVNAKMADMTLLQEEIDSLLVKLVHRAEAVVMSEKEKLADEMRSLQSLRDEVQPYFDAVRKLQMITRKVPAENLTAEKAAELLSAAEAAQMTELEEQNAIETYQQILAVLGYRFEQETVQQTQVKLKKLMTEFSEVSNFSLDVLVSKLNALDSVLTNQSLLNRQQALEACRRKNQELDSQIAKLWDLQKIASGKAEEIRTIVEQLSRKEYETVGPALVKLYNKLARFNIEDGIKIELENDGISLVDNKGKNIVNVLSNGQISVFMLAYFFAGISARNNREKLKIFFIDDLTACMDDVNMLAFMDLLKYQMSSKATMEQLFFITCDERISKLLKYKLSGRGIELCELGEEDFLSPSAGSIVETV